MEKILIIRLSSIGDIIQCMSVITGIKNKYPHAEVHWIVRSDLASLLRIDPRIDKIWEFDRKGGLFGIFKLGLSLKKQDYSHIYDAHSNIRSNILKGILAPWFKSKPNLITRLKHRFHRLLLFKFGINKLPNPFKALASFQKPLKKWDINEFNTPFNDWHFPSTTEEKIATLITSQIPAGQKWVTLVPSAAWDLKRWPINHWKELIQLKEDYHFVVLGGPTDAFCDELKSVAPSRVINLAGKTSLMESFCAIWHSTYVISGDTGFLHAADLFQKPGSALIGPTAFGFPSNPKMKVLEVDLPCRPCTKDGNVECKLNEKKKCMIDIYPKTVAQQLTKDYPSL